MLLLLLVFHVGLLVASSVACYARAAEAALGVAASSPEGRGPFSFRGGGFHMHLVLDAKPWMDTVDVELDVERGLFFDLEELRGRFSVEHVSSAAPEEARGASQREVVTDVTADYALAALRSADDFDIEAPVFRVDPSPTAVSLSFRRVRTGEGSSAGGEAAGDDEHARLRFLLPVHARYPRAFLSETAGDHKNLLAEGPAIALDALLHADPRATSEACLSRMKWSWTSSSRGRGGDRDAAVPGATLCTRVPAGELRVLPMVHTLLTALLWLGALIIFGCLYVPPLW